MPTMARLLWPTDGTPFRLWAHSRQQLEDTSQAMDSDKVIVDGVLAYPREFRQPRRSTGGFYWCEWCSRHQSHRERLACVRKTRSLACQKGVVIMGASLAVTPIIISLLLSISVSNKTHTTHTETENSVDTPHRRGNS